MHLKFKVRTFGTSRNSALKTDKKTWNYIEGVSFGSHCHGGSLASKMDIAKYRTCAIQFSFESHAAGYIQGSALNYVERL